MKGELKEDYDLFFILSRKMRYIFLPYRWAFTCQAISSPNSNSDAILEKFIHGVHRPQLQRALNNINRCSTNDKRKWTG